MRVEIEVGDDVAMVVEGIFVFNSLDRDGKRKLSIASFGKPSPWSQVGMLQVALDRKRGNLTELWAHKGEEEDV